MKRLFKLGLIALLGICGLVSMGHAQQTIVTVDTTASTEAGCTLNEETGVWATQVDDDDNFAPVLKLVNASDTAKYRVVFTAKDAEGEDFDFSSFTDYMDFNSKTTVMVSDGSLYQLSFTPGEYTITFTLKSCGISSAGKEEDYSDVPGADPLTIKIKFPELSFTLTPNPAATSTIEGEDEEGNAIERWVFPTQTAPEFTVGFEGGVPSSDQIIVMGFDQLISSPNNATSAQPVFETELQSLSFTFKPMSEEEEGDEEDVVSLAEVAEYFPDGDYTIMVTDYQNIFNFFYIRIGNPKTIVYGFEAVGATTETQEGDEYKKFSTEEATFAVIAENAPEGWYAEISILEADDTEADGATLMSGDSIATFSTLAGGKFYFASCVIYNVKGTNVGDTVPVKVFTGADAIPFMVEGEILPPPPPQNPGAYKQKERAAQWTGVGKVV
ncbi:MAG: hypothetical protein K2O37_02770, partial [Bacteroidales bacterium]|nr:hypothetical protein [Bacteroidales bacterium]